MSSVIEALKGLSPEAQLVFMLALLIAVCGIIALAYVIVLSTISSREKTENLRKVIKIAKYRQKSTK